MKFRIDHTTIATSLLSALIGALTATVTYVISRDDDEINLGTLTKETLVIEDDLSRRRMLEYLAMAFERNGRDREAVWAAKESEAIRRNFAIRDHSIYAEYLYHDTLYMADEEIERIAEGFSVAKNINDDILLKLYRKQDPRDQIDSLMSMFGAELIIHKFEVLSDEDFPAEQVQSYGIGY